MWEFWKQAARSDSGQDLIEYGFLAMFIAIIAWVTVQSIGGDVDVLYNTVQPATNAAAGS